MPAQACSLDDHCYARADADDIADNHGITGVLSASCLYNTDDGNFVTNEIWDGNTSPLAWEEVGITSGVGTNGIYYSDKTWFWADYRPDNGYDEHIESGLSPAGSDEPYEVAALHEASDEWSLWGGNSYQKIGTSTGQTAALNQGFAGTEYTSYAGQDIRDAGYIYDLERESTAGDYYDWGAAYQDPYSGYITGSYNQAETEESWSWNC